MYHLMLELFASYTTHITSLSRNDKLCLQNDVSVSAIYMVLWGQTTQAQKYIIPINLYHSFKTYSNQVVSVPRNFTYVCIAL